MPDRDDAREKRRRASGAPGDTGRARHDASPPTVVELQPGGTTAHRAEPREERRRREGLGFLLDVLGWLVRVVEQVAERAAFPLGLLVVAGLFLLIQDRIDRNDPKLAFAPLYAEPDLPFEPSNGAPS